MRFDWVEPIAGLFHLQMNVLKMLLHVFEGEAAGESFGVRRFATMLRRQGVTKDVKDFHACDDFFRTLAEGYVVAMYMHTIGFPAGQFNQLDRHFKDSDWPECACRTVANLAYFQVEGIRGDAAKRVLQEVGKEMQKEKWHVQNPQEKTWF